MGSPSKPRLIPLESVFINLKRSPSFSYKYRVLASQFVISIPLSRMVISRRFLSLSVERRIPISSIFSKSSYCKCILSPFFFHGIYSMATHVPKRFTLCFIPAYLHQHRCFYPILSDKPVKFLPIQLTGSHRQMQIIM